MYLCILYTTLIYLIFIYIAPSTKLSVGSVVNCITLTEEILAFGGELYMYTRMYVHSMLYLYNNTVYLYVYIDVLYCMYLYCNYNMKVRHDLSFNQSL